MGLKEILSKVKIDGINPYKSLEEEIKSEIKLWISTGAISLDKAIVGNDPNREGGIPHGRVVEIYGMESSGKSSLLDSIIKNFQIEHGGYVLLCDSENAHEEDRMMDVGIDPDQIVLIEKKEGGKANNKDVTLEEFFVYSEAAIKEIRKEEETPVLVALDSLAMISTESQEEAFGEDRNLKMNENTDKAKVMSSRFGKFTKLMTNNNATLIVVNQLREKPGVKFGDPKYTPGGNALRFYSSIRIALAKHGYILPKEDIYEYDHEDPVGLDIEFKVIKNKIAPPFRTGTFPLMFDDRGIFSNLCLWNMFINKKMWEKHPDFEKSGSWFSWKNERIGQGSGQALKFLCENPDVLEDMKETFFGKKEEEE